MTEGVRTIDLGDGVTIRPTTPADAAAVNADMRDADRAEYEVFGLDGEDFMKWEFAFTVLCDGDIVGIAGFLMFQNGSVMSQNRLFGFMSTNAVWRHKVKFVKHSRKVFDAVAALGRPWVTDFYAIPMSAYKASIRWQERVLGFRIKEEVVLNGIPHTILHRRKEV